MFPTTGHEPELYFTVRMDKGTRRLYLDAKQIKLYKDCTANVMIAG